MVRLRQLYNGYRDIDIYYNNIKIMISKIIRIRNYRIMLNA